MKPSPRQTINKGLLLRLVGTLLTLGLLVWLFAQQGWEKIAAACVQIGPWRLVAALALTFISRLATGMRWHMLLRSSGAKVTIEQTMRLTFAGLFAANYLPTTVGGDVVRLAGAVQLGFDGAVSAATLVVDRLVGMAGMTVMLPWGIGPFLSSGIKLGSRPPVGMAAGLLARSDALSKLRSTFLRLWKRFSAALVAGARHPRALLAAFGFTLIHMVCTFSSIWLMLDGVNQPIAWMTIAGVWSLVYFVTLLPVSINGYGLQELSVVLLYSQLGGISSDASMTIALLIRTLTMAASLPGALFVPGILSASKTTRQTAEEVR